MAPYLAMMAIGEFDVDAYTSMRIQAWDALDPDLFATPLPTTGDQFAYSQQGDFAYKRLTRTISVPASGAQLSFWVDYVTRGALGLRVRGGAHPGCRTTGRPCPTSTATPARTPASPAPGGTTSTRS